MSTNPTSLYEFAEQIRKTCKDLEGIVDHVPMTSVEKEVVVATIVVLGTKASGYEALANEQANAVETQGS